MATEKAKENLKILETVLQLISLTSQKIKIIFHVFPVATRFARCFTLGLSIEEVLGISPSPQAYLEERARSLSKSQRIYDDSPSLSDWTL